MYYMLVQIGEVYVRESTRLHGIQMNWKKYASKLVVSSHMKIHSLLLYSEENILFYPLVMDSRGKLIDCDPRSLLTSALLSLK